MACKDCVRNSMTGMVCECVVCHILLVDHFIFSSVIVFLCKILFITCLHTPCAEDGVLADEELTTAGQVVVTDFQ